MSLPILLKTPPQPAPRSPEQEQAAQNQLPRRQNLGALPRAGINLRLGVLARGALDFNQPPAGGPQRRLRNAFARIDSNPYQTPLMRVREANPQELQAAQDLFRREERNGPPPRPTTRRAAMMIARQGSGYNPQPQGRGAIPNATYDGTLFDQMEAERRQLQTDKEEHLNTLRAQLGLNANADTQAIADSIRNQNRRNELLDMSTTNSAGGAAAINAVLEHLL